MRTPRCHVELALAANTETTLPATAARHLRQVLRMRPGDKVILFNGHDGKDYKATLISLNKQEVWVSVNSAGTVEPAPRLAIHLAIGISKGSRMDFAMQKAVELGVSSISPLVTERTVVRLADERMTRRIKHWMGVMIHACDQSGRRRIPALEPVRKLDDWLEHNSFPGLLLDHEADICLADVDNPGRHMCILVGPEGGLSAEEKQRARIKGMQGIRMGPRIMRTETAPLAAIAALQLQWGDFC